MHSIPITTTCWPRGRGGRCLAHGLPAPHGFAAAIVEWVSATGPQAFRRRLLPRAQRAAYLAEYERRVAAAYPARADGKLLLAFPRLFIVARKQGMSALPIPRHPPRRPGRHQRLPVCDHYSGVEARMRKSLQLQAEMTQEFGACVFDVTLDCEDGAPVGGEAEHAALVVELALASARSPRRGARAPGRPSRLRERHRHHRRQGWRASLHIMLPKVESLADVERAEQALLTPPARLAAAGLIESPLAVRTAPSTSPRIRACSPSALG
jgi:hypothetical protein